MTSSILKERTGAYRKLSFSLAQTIPPAAPATDIFLLATPVNLRDELSASPEHAHYNHPFPVGDVRLRGNDAELHGPPSGVSKNTRRGSGCLLHPEQEEEKLGVEPVLRPGGVHGRRAALHRKGTNCRFTDLV